MPVEVLLQLGHILHTGQATHADLLSLLLVCQGPGHGCGRVGRTDCADGWPERCLQPGSGDPQPAGALKPGSGQLAPPLPSMGGSWPGSSGSYFGVSEGEEGQGRARAVAGISLNPTGRRARGSSYGHIHCDSAHFHHDNEFKNELLK